MHVHAGPVGMHQNPSCSRTRLASCNLALSSGCYWVISGMVSRFPWFKTDVGSSKVPRECHRAGGRCPTSIMQCAALWAMQT